MPATGTWEQVRSQFTDKDIQCMLDVTNKKLDLDDCESTKAMVEDVWSRIEDGSMPPGGGWPQDWKDNFKAWMDAGCPCS